MGCSSATKTQLVLRARRSVDRGRRFCRRLEGGGLGEQVVVLVDVCTSERLPGRRRRTALLPRVVDLTVSKERRSSAHPCIAANLGTNEVCDVQSRVCGNGRTSHAIGQACSLGLVLRRQHTPATRCSPCCARRRRRALSAQRPPCDPPVGWQVARRCPCAARTPQRPALCGCRRPHPSQSDLPGIAGRTTIKTRRPSSDREPSVLKSSHCVRTTSLPSFSSVPSPSSSYRLSPIASVTVSAASRRRRGRIAAG